MKNKLVAVALISVLISMVIGSNICCTTEPTTEYDLTISSTAGGNVTDPGEGTFTYDEGTDVNLVATPDANYVFIEWTGDVGTISDVEDASTTITMNGDYSITANFGFDMTFIDEVPDTNQPPTQTLPTTALITNYCAPMAMVNILGYWDTVMGHSNAENLTAFQQPANLNTVAEYLGYFMDTNNTGSPVRLNGTTYPPAAGTYAADISPGTWEFVRWDAANLFLTPPPGFPTGKLGYDWMVTNNYSGGLGFEFYKAEIDAGRPLVVCFFYWNPESVGINYPDPETGETIDVFKWGLVQSDSGDPDPVENWNFAEGEECIGHAVTGVGYILNWDPDGAGELPSNDYVIVHDNWATTPENVAIPWGNCNSLHAADPGPDA
jgi:hypothetical protein